MKIGGNGFANRFEHDIYERGSADHLTRDTRDPRLRKEPGNRSLTDQRMAGYGVRDIPSGGDAKDARDDGIIRVVKRFVGFVFVVQGGDDAVSLGEKIGQGAGQGPRRMAKRPRQSRKTGPQNSQGLGRYPLRIPRAQADDIDHAIPFCSSGSGGYLRTGAAIGAPPRDGTAGTPAPVTGGGVWPIPESLADFLIASQTVE